MFAYWQREVFWNARKRPRPLGLELLQLLRGVVTTSECVVYVDQILGSLPLAAPQLGFMKKEDLTLGHQTDGGGGSISTGDEAGIDVCPAGAFSCATNRSCCRRSVTSPTKKGPLTIHHT